MKVTATDTSGACELRGVRAGPSPGRSASTARDPQASYAGAAGRRSGRRHRCGSRAHGQLLGERPAEWPVDRRVDRRDLWPVHDAGLLPPDDHGTRQRRGAASEESFVWYVAPSHVSGTPRAAVHLRQVSRRRRVRRWASRRVTTTRPRRGRSRPTERCRRSASASSVATRCSWRRAVATVPRRWRVVSVRWAAKRLPPESALMSRDLVGGGEPCTGGGRSALEHSRPGRSCPRWPASASTTGRNDRPSAGLVLRRCLDTGVDGRSPDGGRTATTACPPRAPPTSRGPGADIRPPSFGRCSRTARVVSQASGKCLADPDDNVVFATRLKLDHCDATAQQRWHVE